MKKRILGAIEKEVRKQYPDYSEDEIEVVMYGVESIYILITKTIVIFSIAFILGIVKEMIMLLLTFNFIRMFAFGMHANDGKVCLIISSIIFIGFTYACKYLVMPDYIHYALYLIAFILIMIYAPADTKKRPLINKKKRIKFKIISLIVVLIYFIISLNINNLLIKNALIFGLLTECILILPITYKIFRMPYKNYVNYGLNIPGV